MLNTVADAARAEAAGLARVHVAVGVVLNARNEVLLALRQAHQHQGGRWEFPGGKVEAGETVSDALRRELQEEVQIEVDSCEPLLVVDHDYGDKQVRLDVWCVTAFRGQAEGREGQQLCWASLHELSDYTFPEANLAIVKALQLRARPLMTEN